MPPGYLSTISFYILSFLPSLRTCETIGLLSASFLLNILIDCVVALRIVKGAWCKEMGWETGRPSHMEQTLQPKLVPGKSWGKSKPHHKAKMQIRLVLVCPEISIQV